MGSTAPATPPQARALLSGTSLMLIGATAVVLIALVWAAAMQRLRFEREQAVAAEIAKNDNLAVAHEERTSRSIEVVDTLLRFVRDDHLHPGPDVALSARLASLGSDARFINVLSVIGPQGEVLAASAEMPPETNFASRAYFQHHAAHASDELLIGQPIIGRVTNQHVISLTRRIELPGGGFGGVVFLSMKPAFFSRLYERSHNGANGALALIGLDGITRVRRNGDKVSYGEDIRKSQLFKELPKAPAGHYVAHAASDGVMRAVSYRQLEAYPLIVVVGSSLEEVLALAAHRSRATLFMAAMATALIAALAALLALVVTRKARHLAAIEGSERRHRLLFENSLDAILRTQPDGTVLAANAAACLLFDADEPVLRGTPPEQLFVSGDTRHAALMASLKDTGQARGHVTLKRADGSHFEAELSANLYLDADGQQVASLVVRDLTERMAADAERLQLEVQLRQSQKLESVGTLAGGIAHDFNNILAAILGNTAIARQDLAAGKLAPDVLDRIAQAASRARSLVQQILTFSRRMPEQRQVHVVQPLVQEAIALLRATLPATVRLEVSLPAEPLTVLTDATQLEQVVLNLCTNAWQALSGHNGRVRVSVQALPPDEGPAGGAGWLRLRVEDDGIGMAPETRARLFEPFFTTKSVGTGTGLGLAVVHGIVASHGGRVEVRSAPGEGSCFDVLLPLAGQACLAADETRQPAPHGSGERLLYVDDDEVVRITVESLLQRLGYRVTTCAEAQTAIGLLGRDPDAFSLVITDFNMPDMSGLALAEQMLRLRPDLPIIVSSGYVSEDLRQRAAELGVRRVMMKEYTLEHLGGIVDEILSETRDTALATAA